MIVRPLIAIHPFPLNAESAKSASQGLTLTMAWVSCSIAFVSASICSAVGCVVFMLSILFVSVIPDK